MASLTKAQLVAQLEASHVSYQRLEAECVALRAAAKLLSAPRQVLPAQSAAHDSYVRALLNAKTLAMRTGRCVRVG